jgi:hypothetical protein
MGIFDDFSVHSRLIIPSLFPLSHRPDIEKIDAYKLEVYDPEGILLGEIKLDHRVHGLRICKNFLFAWEANFDKVYQYEIVEK